MPEISLEDASKSKPKLFWTANKKKWCGFFVAEGTGFGLAFGVMPGFPGWSLIGSHLVEGALVGTGIFAIFCLAIWLWQRGKKVSTPAQSPEHTAIIGENLAEVESYFMDKKRDFEAKLSYLPPQSVTLIQYSNGVRHPTDKNHDASSGAEKWEHAIDKLSEEIRKLGRKYDIPEHRIRYAVTSVEVEKSMAIVACSSDQTKDRQSQNTKMLIWHFPGGVRLQSGGMLRGTMVYFLKHTPQGTAVEALLFDLSSKPCPVLPCIAEKLFQLRKATPIDKSTAPLLLTS